MAEQYTLEIHLTTGVVVSCDLPKTGAAELARSNPGVGMPPDEPDEGRAIARMVHMMLMHRIDKGSGYYSLTDVAGRQWTIPAQAILAYNIGKAKSLGFPIIETVDRAPESSTT